MNRPKYDHETPEEYAAQTLIHEIIAEEKRLDPWAHEPHFQLGYITSLFASILAKSPAAKRDLEIRLEHLKTR